MKFAARIVFACLAVGLCARGQDIGDLKKDLRDNDDEKRRRAVTALAELDTKEAWELVIDAMSDSEARVADQAQIELGNTENEHARAGLLDKRGIKSRAESVQGRAIEALGRSTSEVATGVFLKALAHKVSDLRLRAAWSVERLARAEKLGDDPKQKLAKVLERLVVRDKVIEVRAQAFAALVALKPDEAKERIAFLAQSSEPELLVAALQATEWGEDSAAFALANTHAAHPSPSVRRACVEIYGRLGTYDSVGRLIERLGIESNMRLSWRIVEHLQDMSGRRSRRKVPAWKRWYESLTPDWVADARSADRDYGGTTSAFVGIPVLSENIAFLIDFSGSTWERRENGKTRKSVLDVELRKALEALPEDTWFNVIPYATEPIPWKDELVPANKRNVKQAIEAFERNKTSGKGDFLSAALLALSDPRVDTIMVLTDGSPTGGEHWNMELLVPWLVEKNRVRQVAIDSLLVDTKGRLARFWEELGKATGGRSVRIDLE